MATLAQKYSDTVPKAFLLEAEMEVRYGVVATMHVLASFTIRIIRRTETSP